MSYEVEINGVTYESRPRTSDSDSCKGCVGFSNDNLCELLPDNCHDMKTNFINKEKPMAATVEEPKYIVKEVLEAVEQVVDEYFTDHQKKQIIDILTRKNNPEYKLYLELKEKFGE